MTIQPTGTVTFLFTDIEGSTRLLQRLGDRYVDVLAAQRALLRAAFTTHHGYEVDTQGDSFCVAFARASDAVLAAVHAQQALAAHPWPDGLPVRVRMGLHTGEPTPVDDRYVGLDLHRAARIGAAGHGGQVVLSQTTRDLVEAGLPPGVTLRDLGEHRLKDLRRPRRLYQLLIPGLPADFPPLKTLDARPNNLPTPPTPLVDREEDTARVMALLRAGATRVVTVIGPGGVGKTRLALHIATELLEEFPQGVYFVALASLNDPAQVAPAIAQAVGIREESGRGPLDNVVHNLRDKRVLLVLDNFEQVTRGATVVAQALSGCPRVKALVTSRAPLQIRGEQEWPLAPLALPPRHADRGRGLPPGRPTTDYSFPAVELFVQRAAAVKPDFSLAGANGPAVVEICARLDGLPLALELAAARVKLLPPPALLKRLDRRLAVLTGGSRDLPERHQTLRAAIEWSHDLLSVEEQALFRRLAVFVSGFTLEAVEAVIGDEGLAIRDWPRNPQSPIPNLQSPVSFFEGLERLVGESLLRQDDSDEGDIRFGMLETIREFALERLEAGGEGEAMRARHTAYYLALVEEAEPGLRGAEQAVWLKRLDAEHDNLRAALSWSLGHSHTVMALRLAAALQAFWYNRGFLTEGRGWLEQTLAAVSPHFEESIGALPRASIDLWIKALNGAGIFAWGQGDYGVARERYERSLALSRMIGDDYSLARALNNLGQVADDQGDYGAAQGLYAESLVIWRRLNNLSAQAMTLNNLGLVARAQGDVLTAGRLYTESLHVRRALGDRRGMAVVLSNLAELVLGQGETGQAQALYAESLTLREELKDRRGMASSLCGLGLVALAEGDVALAATRLAESLSLRGELADRRGIAECLEAFARLSLVQSRPDRAATLLGAADALRQAIGAPRPPTTRQTYDQTLAEAQRRLSATECQAALMRGAALTVEQAVQFALASVEQQQQTDPKGFENL